MLGTIQSCALLGVDAFPVVVEVDVSFGLPAYRVVGLPAASVTEGSVRIRCALAQVGLDLPNLKVTVNLAPADQRKQGAAFDLPIAVGLVVANESAPAAAVEDLLLLGELGLDGELRPVRGALAAGLLARELGLRGVLLPEASAGEAAVVDGIETYAAAHLSEVVAAMQGTAPLRRFEPESAAEDLPQSAPGCGDMSDVRGQQAARLALEVAVAGGHNLLFVGPPGIGKTMLARRVPTILPSMSRAEALQTTQVYSAVGLAPRGLVRERPFRAPHHSISEPALIGGGAPLRPGEISMAHNGVLFLDELPEFRRNALEALRQPLEDREVTVCRVHATATMPASFLLVASSNPCPCGWFGTRERTCTCGPAAIERYRNKLSGPLLDRMDLQVHVPLVTVEAMREQEPGESSAAIRERVVAARELQRHRLASYGLHCNAEMSPRAVRETCQLSDAAETVLLRLGKLRKCMTGRSVDRLLKVARTIADLRGQSSVDADAVYEAASYRALDGDPVAEVPRLNRSA